MQPAGAVVLCLLPPLLLSLLLLMVAEGEEGAADFLSSIEILVAERADVMLMQNWAHVVTGKLHGRRADQAASGVCAGSTTDSNRA